MEIFNRLLLGLIHPPGHRDEQEPEGIEDLFNVRTIIASLTNIIFPRKSRQFSEIQFSYHTGSREIAR
jgi:hypothetical protein